MDLNTPEESTLGDFGKSIAAHFLDPQNPHHTVSAVFHATQTTLNELVSTRICYRHFFKTPEFAENLSGRYVVILEESGNGLMHAMVFYKNDTDDTAMCQYIYKSDQATLIKSITDYLIDGTHP